MALTFEVKRKGSVLVETVWRLGGSGLEVFQHGQDCVRRDRSVADGVRIEADLQNADGVRDGGCLVQV